MENEVARLSQYTTRELLQGKIKPSGEGMSSSVDVSKTSHFRHLDKKRENHLNVIIIITAAPFYLK
jgi:hypothetical protein